MLALMICLVVEIALSVDQICGGTIPVAEQPARYTNPRPKSRIDQHDSESLMGQPK